MATYTSNYGWVKPSGSDNVDISVLNDNLDNQDSTIHDAFLNMAPPFSESSTYAVDDIVLYTTGLYKCHTAVVTPGSWTGSTNWQVYKLSEGGSGGGGTSNYNDLTNKPSINNVTLSGNKTAGDLGLQSELTFDNVPTDGSNNPVKSDGIYDSEKDIYAVMGQMGAKNLIPYPYYEDTEEDRGITWTNNADGTITITGTATNDSAHNLSQRNNTGKLYLPNGKYKLSGCPSGGSNNTYYLEALCTKNSSANSLGIDNGTGVDITVNGDDYGINGAYIMVRGIVKNGQTVSNLTFKPMLRLASDTDDTYQPYAKTNRELTDELKSEIDKFWSLGSGMSIANNTDLNDITTPGNYYATTPAAATLSHCPIPGAFKLKVLYDVRESAPTYIEQVFNPMSSYDEYRRYKAGSAEWSDWHLTNCNLDNIIAKIPDAPTTDGTYNLSVTVVNGTPTYSWVSTS